jgi:hypothetical protein
MEATGEGLYSQGMPVDDIKARLLVLEQFRSERVDPYVYYIYYTYDMHHGSQTNDGAVDYFKNNLEA